MLIFFFSQCPRQTCGMVKKCRSRRSLPNMSILLNPCLKISFGQWVYHLGSCYTRSNTKSSFTRPKSLLTSSYQEVQRIRLLFKSSAIIWKIISRNDPMRMITTYNNHQHGPVVIIQKMKVSMYLQPLQLAHTNRFPNKQHLRILHFVHKIISHSLWRGGYIAGDPSFHVCMRSCYKCDRWSTVERFEKEK